MKNKNIHYVDHGPREAMSVVLVHAFPLNHTMWNPQISALSAKHRVVAYDIRGHGESDAGDGQYTIELFVDDLMALLDHLKIKKTILCGLSMGGYIALRALERYPERFSALILADTRSEADSDEAKIKRSAALKLIKEKGVSVFAEGFVKPAFAPETFNTNPQIIQTVKEMILKNPPLGICGSLLGLASRTDTTASLKEIKIPTLILVGEKDQITPPSASLSMKEKIQNAEMHLIPNAGHLSNLENPVEFNQRLISFIKEIP
ncbi:MAG: alpha/beta fold hydrolase [Deltaproteobacteria bacterium]|nr:alpha/beta fold hydrolase [Deltaproteobacteria bacterium]